MFMETGRSFFFLPFFLSRIVETSERRETDSQRHQEAVTINQHSAQGVKAAQAGVWESERRQSQLISAGSVLLERSAGPRRSSSSTFFVLASALRVGLLVRRASARCLACWTAYPSRDIPQFASRCRAAGRH